MPLIYYLLISVLYPREERVRKIANLGGKGRRYFGYLLTFHILILVPWDEWLGVTYRGREKGSYFMTLTL